MDADIPPEPTRVESPRESTDKKRSNYQKRPQKAADSEEAVDPQKAPVDSSTHDPPTEDPQKDEDGKDRECQDDFTSTDEEILLKHWDRVVYICLHTFLNTSHSS